MRNSRKLILTLGLSIFLFSCAETEQKTVVVTDTLTSPTKTTSIDTPSEFVALIDSTKNDSLPDVSDIEGVVYYTLPYCGGARPTEEMLAELAVPKSFTLSTLRLENEAGKFFIYTDSKGEFTSALPLGKFKVYLTSKTNKTIYDVSKNACENCLSQPITTVKIIAGKKARIEFKFNCSAEAKLRP